MRRHGKSGRLPKENAVKGLIIEVDSSMVAKYFIDL